LDSLYEPVLAKPTGEFRQPPRHPKDLMSFIKIDLSERNARGKEETFVLQNIYQS
jgi:hypothetical protein